jgi:TatD family-associated radical SAM protein
MVARVVGGLSRIHGVPPEEVVRQTTENFALAMRIEEKTLPPPVYKIGNRVYIHTIPDTEPGSLADLAAQAAGDIAGGGEGPDGRKFAEEAVICGFHEPLEHMGQVTAVAGRLRAEGVRVRVITGSRGHAAVRRDAAESLTGVVDALTVRMYGATPAQHEQAAMTGLGNAAFTSLTEFVEGAVGAGIETDCLFISVPKMKVDRCRALAKSLGAGCEVRRFRSLETQGG